MVRQWPVLEMPTPLVVPSLVVTGQSTLATVTMGTATATQLAVTGGLSIPASTIGALPSAVGRANEVRLVTDILIGLGIVIGAIAVGGGAGRGMVASDGTNWRIC